MRQFDDTPTPSNFTLTAEQFVGALGRHARTESYHLFVPRIISTGAEITDLDYISRTFFHID
jgi:hypothetical protein